MEKFLLALGLWEEFKTECELAGKVQAESCQDVIDGFDFSASERGSEFWWGIQIQWEDHTNASV